MVNFIGWAVVPALQIAATRVLTNPHPLEAEE